MYFLDEKLQTINHLECERTEQLQAERYITPDSVVLELGARYGTVSCVINSKLSNPANQVSVEPDNRVQGALEQNMKTNGCNFHILKGVISRTPIQLAEIDSYGGYGTTSVKVDTSSIKSYTLEEVEGMYGLTFNTLVADCEGFLEQFMDENPKLYQQLNLILFEKDYPHKCNYDKIIMSLCTNGFFRVEAGFHEVWKKH
jgi:FkbM family methyltransferase